MTQKEKLLEMFRQNGNELMLYQIMNTTLGCEFRARFSELRRGGVNIIFQRGEMPSLNKYTLIPNEASRKLMESGEPQSDYLVQSSFAFETT